MTIRIVASFKALPGKGGDFAKAFAPGIEASRKDPGCQQYELFRSEDDPDRLVLIELWEDQASLDGHFAASRTRGPSPTTPFRDGNATLEQYELSHLSR